METDNSIVRKKPEPFSEEFLVLKLMRLAPKDSWTVNREGLVFVLPQAGAGNYAVNGGLHPLRPHDVLFFYGGVDLHLEALPSSELAFSCFSVRLEHLYPLFSGGEISLLSGLNDALQQPRHLPANLPLARQCHRLADEVTPHANLDHRSQLLRVASVVLTEEFKHMHEQRASTLGLEAHLLQIFERLSADELLTISVPDLATKFSCSRRHLNRLFHQYFGFSVASLRMEMRLLKSISLLRDANLKIINVAEQCGFNHLGLFNTCFKRRFGISPGHWRKHPHDLKPETSGAGNDHATCPLRAKGLCPMTSSESGMLGNPSPNAAWLPGNLPPAPMFPPQRNAAGAKSPAPAPKQNGGGK
jgi:AraC-like DNA-binding protein